MRKIAFALLASALTLTSAARADTIDDFVLTGEGNAFTWSLPASPVVFASTGAGGVLGGYEVEENFLISNHGVTSLANGIEFFSGQLFYLGAGLRFGVGGADHTIVGPALYTGDATDFTFKSGSFSMHDFFGVGNPYDLTISPESLVTPSVPEPSSFALLATGASALFGLARRRRYSL